MRMIRMEYGIVEPVLRACDCLVGVCAVSVWFARLLLLARMHIRRQQCLRVARMAALSTI